MGESQFNNRLSQEKSPYLLQHAHNPVDWYPWTAEAFEVARKQDKPIFLSIGYATCHWCHVMEQESFENPEIAKLMNETFVSIKVDREELPQVDSMYMEFAQVLMSSAGGWPLNLVLTPALKPFFAVTYLPPVTRRGLIGMDEFCKQIGQLWTSEERGQLLTQADKIVEMFQKATHSYGEDLPTTENLTNAVQVLFDVADPTYGGVKGEPKFPLGYQIYFLLQYSRDKKESRALFYVELTLEMMARGGIYDHLGGGFSRYSIDERWLIPHFEKMLYDNAILAETYLEAWKFTKQEKFKEIAVATLEYLMREMKAPNGGFYSGQDADSEGKEGLYYTWTPAEVKEILGEQEGEFFCQFYGITLEGNFEGRNVLHIDIDVQQIAEVYRIPADEIESKLRELRIKLLEQRQKRPAPFKDDKIITSWNGFVIQTMIKAGSTLKEKRYTDAALETAQFIKKNLWKEGKLLRRFRDGDARHSATLEDYAFLTRGLLTLFSQGLGTEWLEWAIQLVDVLKQDYKASSGAFYQTSSEEPMLLRLCEFYDGAEPSGNAVHCENLLRLYQITQSETYLAQAEDILKAVKEHLEAFPPGACYHLSSLERYFDRKAPLLIIILNDQNEFEEEIKEALNARFSPHAEVIWKRAGDALLPSLISGLNEKSRVNNKTTFYLCTQEGCQPPLSAKEEIFSAIEKL